MNEPQHLSESGPRDWLPSWTDGPVKQTVLDFLQQVSVEASPHYMPPADRLAVFNGAGTLWPEKPLLEAQFALTRIHQAADLDPSLWMRQPFKAALEGDLRYLAEAPVPAILELIGHSHAGIRQDFFELEARAFLEQALHPQLGVPVGELAYPAMHELVALLQACNFQIWVCSAATVELVRILAERLYGVPREHVIGSVLAEEFRDLEGAYIWRRSQVITVNDYEAKPVALARQSGRRPLLAVGSLQCRGDVAMLRFSQKPSAPGLQLLIHHDDPQRELAYNSDDSMMLEIARKAGFQVVSMKQDWRQVLSTQVRTIVVDVTRLAARSTTLADTASPAQEPGSEE